MTAIQTVHTIPKIIHQMWLDKNTLENHSYPIKYSILGYPSSWQKKNPRFKYKFWNGKMIEDILVQYPKHWQDFYHNTIARHIEKCDFARYLVLLFEGGVYVDLDFECLKSIDELIMNKTLALVWEPREHVGAKDITPKRLFNGFIGSVAGHELWHGWMEHIIGTYDPERSVHSTTGPEAFSKYCTFGPFAAKLTPNDFVDTCSVVPYAFNGKLVTECESKMERTNFIKPHFNMGTNWQNNSYTTTSNGIIVISVSVAVLVLVIGVGVGFAVYYSSKQKANQRKMNLRNKPG